MTQYHTIVWSPASYLAGWRTAMTEAKGGDWNEEFPVGWGDGWLASEARPLTEYQIRADERATLIAKALRAVRRERNKWIRSRAQPYGAALLLVAPVDDVIDDVECAIRELGDV